MPEQNAVLTWLAEELAGQIRGVLESMAGEAPRVQFDSCEVPETDSAEQNLWWEQPLSLSPDALIWIGAGQPAWEGIGQRVLRGAGVEEEDRETSRSTYLEIVTQVLSGLAASISSRIHKEVSLDPGHEAPCGAGSAAFSFQIGFPDLEMSILAAFSRPLPEFLSVPPPAHERVEAPRPIAPAPAPLPNSIDLLLDVELPVSVSFGRAQLALKDVIKLTTGSIVELNRSVSEPVEVIVNNCVIARGEVVVVEGNFGIRIKQVISRQERLRTLN
ncbi:MAG TPA: flagellar motor switch protein FliN [Bryobacteraceae bacterium]|nr:flagellar motor switch protein FliN [Bryobacteraceae bacterium]